ncbi:MAG: hypothetical protein LUG60_01280 [Erysipelotrichaceae bacterium]|nr:hypothetical protein [Erysipelotrichaceae bacterium]
MSGFRKIVKKAQKTLLKFMTMILTMSMIFNMFGSYVAAVNKDIYGFEYTSSSLEVDYGTSQDDITFPTTITSIIALDTSVSSDDFHHVDAPESDYEIVDYDTYKYDAIYDNTDTYGYRVYGYIDDADNPCWYACNSLGSVYYVIDDLDASWECDDYDEYTSDTYTFKLKYDTNTYSYSGILPSITVTVGENPIATVAEEDEPTTATTTTVDAKIGETVYLPAGSYTVDYSNSTMSNYIDINNIYETVTSIESGNSYYIVNIQNANYTFLTNQTGIDGSTSGLVCVTDTSGSTVTLSDDNNYITDSSGKTYYKANVSTVNEATLWTFIGSNNSYSINDGSLYINFNSRNVNLSDSSANLSVVLVSGTSYYTIGNGDGEYLDRYSTTFAAGWETGSSNVNERWYLFNQAGIEVKIPNTAKATGTMTVTYDDGSTYIINIEETGTVDSVTTSGTVINLFDYWITTQDDDDNHNFTNSRTVDGTTYDEMVSGINANHLLKFAKNRGQYPNWSSSTYYVDANIYSNSKTVVSGIVSDKLSNGYPVLSNNSSIVGSTDYSSESLSYLFNPSVETSGKASYSNVTGLLQIDEKGYYYYDSTQNYAEYNEETNKFILYDDWAVISPSNKNPGQFFPFDSYSDVTKTTNADLTNCGLNHYFGLTLTTKFIQQYGGKTSKADDALDTTFEFSGDDDVWIFIDDVLVADLGGIHDKASVVINFATGDITITGRGSTITDTIKGMFEKANEDTSDFNGNTFADDTYHTLKFYYLERGNSASNLSLKYNLTEIPQTSISKVNQYGNPVEGAEFAVYQAKMTTDSNGDKVYYYKLDDSISSTLFGNTFTNTELLTTLNGENGVYILASALSEQIKDSDAFTIDESSGNIQYTNGGITTTIVSAKYVGETDSNGEMVFRDSDNMLYSINELEKLFGTSFILKEISVPEGYRLVSDDIFLRIVNSKIMVCDNTYSSGVYATTNEVVSATDTLYYLDNGDTKSATYHDVQNDTVSGTLFAVVLKYSEDTYDSSKTSDEYWSPIYGSDEDGYTVVDATDTTKYDSFIDAAIATAKLMELNGYSDSVFSLVANGSMQVNLTALPGDIETYYHMATNKSDTQYAIAYYWTTGTLDNATASNTYRVLDEENASLSYNGTSINYEGFSRTFGATINVPNLMNALIVQKLDSDGTTLVNGATFAMYEVSEVSNAIYYVANDTNKTLIYLEEDDDGDNIGIAYTKDDLTTKLTYKVSSSDGVITVGDYDETSKTFTTTLYTIKPTDYQTTSEASNHTEQMGQYAEDGTAIFKNILEGTYYIREVSAPDGYDLNTSEIMVLVTDDTIYANAGTRDDGVTVSRSAGYLVSTLAQMAVEGDVDNTLT